MVSFLLIAFLYQLCLPIHHWLCHGPQYNLLTWSLFSQSHSACGLGGYGALFCFHPTTLPVLFQPWRHPVSVGPHFGLRSCVYPEEFTPYLVGCIFIASWFCGMVLRSSGLSMSTWTEMTTKKISPSVVDPRQWTLKDSRELKSLHERWKRKPPPWTPRKKQLMMLFATLMGTLTQAQPIALQSELQFRRRL